MLDRRWQLAFERHSISDQLEVTSDPLATEGEEFSFAWSRLYGSNSGKLLTDIEDNCTDPAASAFRTVPLAEKKIRGVLDSILKESDLRSCLIAFPAVADEESRMEAEELDASKPKKTTQEAPQRLTKAA